jgi:hypothetical protein
MIALAVGSLPRLVLRVLLGLAPLLSPVRAQEDSKPEPFEAVDPYSRGERALLDSAGYVSLGPFPWCEGMTTDALARELGGIPILWVETEHFRIGSTLAAYKVPSDRVERKRLEEELAAIRATFPESKPSMAKLDPWLRLHLYARRVEAVYDEFQRAFGLTEADFGPTKTGEAPRLAAGPYMGMASKFTVLLCEKRSTLARFVRLAWNRDGMDPMRERLPGGSLFFGVSAENVRSWGRESDIAFHSQVAADVSINLMNGFRDLGTSAPVWFEYGWSHVQSRRVEERSTHYARGTDREGRDAWKWQDRVQGLISNGFAPTFPDLAGLRTWDQISGPAHLAAWSKVSWMLTTFGPERMRLFLLAITDPVPKLEAEERATFLQERQLTALQDVGGASLTALEEAWKRWAGKPGSKR